MVLGLPVFHWFEVSVMLLGIALPFLQVANNRHARALLAATMLSTIVGFVLFLWFGSHTSARSDLVLLRCYAASSAFCSLIDTLSLARSEQTSLRFLIVSMLFGIVFLLTLVCLIGGISGAF